MKKLDLAAVKPKADFPMEDALRAGGSLDVDLRKLCAIVREVEAKINEIIEVINDRP